MLWHYNQKAFMFLSSQSRVRRCTLHLYAVDVSERHERASELVSDAVN